MKITFEGTPQEILTEIGVYLGLAKGAFTAPAEAKPAIGEMDDEKALQSARRRSTAKPEPESALDPAPEEEKPKSSRRRGAAKAEPKKTKAKSTAKKITDNAVVKAASQAAEHILPAGVSKVLKTFGVDKVNELDQDQRREFIDTLAAKMGEAE